MKKQQKKKKNSTDGNEHFAENQSWRQKAKMWVKRTEFKSSTRFPDYAKATKITSSQFFLCPTQYWKQ